MQPVTVIFGAFDRHNFGDLLFAHVAAAMLRPRRPVFAGLAAADLRPAGGHRISALPDVLARLAEQRIHFVHAGGELLTCSAWQAAVMLLPPERAPAVVARLDTDVGARTAWAHARIGNTDLVPYAVSAAILPTASRVVYAGVGGVGLGNCSDSMRAEVMDKLRCADTVAVRDRHTQASLAVAGIASHLMPDPASLTAALFDAKIRRHGGNAAGAVASMRRAFPHGYLAVQFSAEFGDDMTLDSLAAGLDQAARSHRYGVVFFRAGTAPWHDDLDCYRRTAQRMQAPSHIMYSTNIWDICALIASASAYLGNSLHGRIIAMAYALPRVSLRSPADAVAGSKQDAYASTWECRGMPGVVAVSTIETALGQALAGDAQDRRNLASQLTASCRKGFTLLAAILAH